MDIESAKALGLFYRHILQDFLDYDIVTSLICQDRFSTFQSLPFNNTINSLLSNMKLVHIQPFAKQSGFIERFVPMI
jgi:hypothetical protein